MALERDVTDGAPPTGKSERLLWEARRRFKRASEAEDAQRKAILKAKQFRAGNQWDPAIRIQRSGGAAIAGLPPQPPRPCLTIDRISGPVRTISNQVRQAHFGISVLPNGSGADDDTAEIYKGLLRRIQNAARGDDPVDWAADGAAEGGIGWFRIRADYCHDEVDEGDPAALFDQDLKLERIANNLTVYCDPAACRPTRSDAKWMFVTEDLPRDEFTRLYPNADLVTLDEFRSTGDEDGWVGDDLIRVAEYWRVEYQKERLALLADGRVVPLKAVQDGEVVVKDRIVYVPEVSCSKITACQELDTYEWRGTRIPLVPVLGEELNVDGKTLVRGIIAPAIGAQEMVNYTFSGAIEIFALGSKSPWVVAEGQTEGYEQIWENANTFNYAYLPYKPTTVGGQLAEPPHRDMAEAPIQAAVLLMQQAEEAIKATTNIYDPSLGNTNPREKSGRAILALQQQSDQTNSNYLDNVQRALIYAGELLVELIPEYYDRPGRVVQLLGIDDQPQQVMLNAPFTKSPQGVPQAAQPGDPNAKTHDLARGKYSITVSIGKAYTTKKEEGTAVWGEVLGKNPQLMPLLGDLFFTNLDTPGAQEAAARLKKMLPPQAQEDPNVSPEVALQQAQSQLQQASQMIQMLTKELEHRTKQVETEAVQKEYDLATAKENNATKLRIAEIQAQTQFGVAEIKALLDDWKARLAHIETIVGHEADARRVESEQSHETAMQASTQQHEATMGLAQMGASAAGQQADQAHQAGMAGQQQAHDAAMAAQQGEEPSQ